MRLQSSNLGCFRCESVQIQSVREETFNAPTSISRENHVEMQAMIAICIICTSEGPSMNWMCIMSTVLSVKGRD